MAKAKQQVEKQYGRGSGNPEPVDVFVGARIRQRRNFLGMNQETLSSALGLTFQQVQKYENGSNRVSAGRLVRIAEILNVDVGYFFAGLSAKPTEKEVTERTTSPVATGEAVDLVRYYMGIGDEAVQTQFQALVLAMAAQSP